MVFSFFKKDTKDSKDRSGDKTAGRARAASKPVGRPLDGPVNRSGKPSTNAVEAAKPHDQARVLAMETAAKIDAIESEMARDFLRPGGTSTQVFANSAANSTLQRPTQVADTALPEPHADPATQPPLEFYNTDVLNGNALAIEVGAADGNAVLEETAILFANGQSDPAEAMLRGAIESKLLGHSALDGWRMLLELIQQRGDRAQFETTGEEYALLFSTLAPAWVEYPSERPMPAPVAAAAPQALEPGLVRLPAHLGAEVVQPLEQLKSLSQQFARLSLDFSDVRTIDLVGAELLLRVINAFKRATHELVIVGPEVLVAALRAALEPGRRDASDAAWMLLIEAYRMLHEQQEFEEAAIQYCITFEVSPPSWEPPPANLRTRPAERLVAAPVAVPEEASGLHWRGVLGGTGEPAFAQLCAEAAKSEGPVVVDCTYLRRVEFTAASSLLSVLTRVERSRERVELKGLNPLVGELLRLLGVGDLAKLSLRQR